MYITLCCCFQSAPVCNARLTFTNTETEEITTLENVDISIADNNITFTTDSLTANVHYRVRVKAVNVHGPSVSKITISMSVDTVPLI